MQIDKIFVASTNQDKIKEIRTIFNSSTGNKLQICSISELDISEPDEPYATFMDNAIHKAKYYASLTQAPTLSEDSGLCVTALNGFPGVNTKQFVLDSGGIDKAYARLEKLLADADNLSAYFVCAACLFIPQNGVTITGEGKHDGTLSFPPRGIDGFAFDLVFVPDGHSQVMAELGRELKNIIGHRWLAIKAVMENLAKVI